MFQTANLRIFFGICTVVKKNIQITLVSLHFSTCSGYVGEFPEGSASQQLPGHEREQMVPMGDKDSCPQRAFTYHLVFEKFERVYDIQVNTIKMSVKNAVQITVARTADDILPFRIPIANLVIT